MSLLILFASLLLAPCLLGWVIGIIAQRHTLISAGVITISTIGLGWFWANHTWQGEFLTLGPLSLSISAAVQSSMAMTMLGLLCGITLLVQLYSLYYFKGHQTPRFYSTLGFFFGSMAMLVMSQDLLLAFMAWELLGICSFLLIGYYSNQTLTGTAATLAFWVNRFSDLAFVLAIVMVYNETGTLNITQLFQGGQLSFGASLALLLGFMGKTAQFPLHRWLPEAMAGPTPVSALLHAATMVVAGVWLLIQLVPIMHPIVVQIMLGIGIITTLFGAWHAWNAMGLKVALAWSSVSQLGLMVTAIGLNAPELAFLHLAVHAVFKAGLFLNAGIALHDPAAPQDQSIRRMPRLQLHHPQYWASAVLLAASASLPLTVAYVSKHAIIEATGADYWRYSLALIGAILSGLYSARLFGLILRPNNTLAQAKRPPLLAISIVIVLALASVNWGYAYWLPWPTPPHADFGLVRTLLDFMPAVITFLAAVRYWQRGFLTRSSSIQITATDAVTLNVYWSAGILTYQFAKMLASIETQVIDLIAVRTAQFWVVLANFTYFIDRYGIDGSIKVGSWALNVLGRRMRKQSSSASQSMLSAALVLVLFLLLYVWLLKP